MENEYVSSEIAERIKRATKEKGVAISAMLEGVELGRNTMANLKTSMPKVDNLAKIADYLNVSVDYLLGRTDNPNTNTTFQNNNTGNIVNVNENRGNNSPLISVNEHTNKNTLELINLINSLSIVEQAEIILKINEMKNRGD